MVYIQHECEYILQICSFPLRYYDLVRDVRQNKGSILKASVDYIRKLKNDQIKKRQLEDKLREQETHNKKLLLKLQVRVSSSSRYCVYQDLVYRMRIPPKVVVACLHRNTRPR